MWEQNPTTTYSTPPARGNIGYVIIKTKTTNMYNFLAYNEGATINNSSTYAGNPTSKPYQGYYGVDWNDNTVQPDEHVWEIEYHNTSANLGQITIKNTAYGHYMPNSSSTVPKYLLFNQNTSNIKNYAITILPPGGSGTTTVMVGHYSAGSIANDYGYISETAWVSYTNLPQYQFEFEFI